MRNLSNFKSQQIFFQPWFFYILCKYSKLLIVTYCTFYVVFKYINFIFKNLILWPNSRNNKKFDYPNSNCHVNGIKGVIFCLRFELGSSTLSTTSKGLFLWISKLDPKSFLWDTFLFISCTLLFQHHSCKSTLKIGNLKVCHENPHISSSGILFTSLEQPINSF